MAQTKEATVPTIYMSILTDDFIQRMQQGRHVLVVTGLDRGKLDFNIVSESKF